MLSFLLLSLVASVIESPVADANDQLLILPSLYSVSLRPVFNSPRGDRLITKTKISAKVTKSTDSFRLFSQAEIDPQDLIVREKDKKIGVKYMEYNSAKAAYDIVLRRKLPTSARVLIIVKSAEEQMLKGNTSSSFSYSSYKDDKGVMRYVAMNHNKKALMFPHLDRRLISASFRLTVTLKGEYYAASSGVDTNSKASMANKLRSKWVDVKFKTTPVMSAEMVGLSVFPYSYFMGKKCVCEDSSLCFCVLGRPRASKALLSRLGKVTKAIRSLESQLKVDFPSKVTDIVIIPNMPSAFESSYRQVRLNEEHASERGSEAFLIEVLLRQWFGFLIAPSSFDTEWLFPAVNIYLRICAWSGILVKEDGDRDALLNQIWWSHAAERGNSLGTIRAANEKHQVAIFAGISHLREMRYWIGEESMLASIGDLLRKNLHRNVNAKDFFYTLLANGASQIHIDSFNKSLNLPGIPVISSSVKDGALLLTQKRFFRSAHEDAKFQNTTDSAWIIPITMVTSDNATTLTEKLVSKSLQWMTQKKQAFQSFKTSSATSWYLLNFLSAGNYRVNYNTANWNAIVNQFNVDHRVFSYQDRSRLIDDSFALASAGFIGFEIPMNLLNYLKRETNRDVLLVVWKNLAEVQLELWSRRMRHLFSKYTCKRRSLLAQLIDDFYNLEKLGRFYIAKYLDDKMKRLCYSRLPIMDNRRGKLGDYATQSLRAWLINNKLKH